MMDHRIFHFIKKELLQLLHDPRMLAVAIIAPVIQLIVLGYVASVDVKHVSTAVLDQDRSVYSRSYINSLSNSGYFNINYYVHDDHEITALLDSGKAALALKIPLNFDKSIIRGDPAEVQAILDGVNSSSALIISGYLNQINFRNSSVLIKERLVKAKKKSNLFDLIDLRLRVWYNPEMKSVNFMVPAIFALILTIITMLLTAFSIVKEKENGTFEQLMVTPIHPYEVIFGKLLPFILIAFLDVILVFLVATLWFGVPMRGSLSLLLLLGGIFLTTGLGLGVFISLISQNQRQAMMSALFVMIPSMILSGFIFPIANMPFIIQAFTYLIPVRYFLEIVRFIFLKGVGLEYLWDKALPLVVIGFVLLTASVIRFKKKIE